MKKIYKFITLLLLFALTGSPGFSQTAKDLLNTGNGKYRSREYTAAIADYSKALSKSPNLVEAYNNRGLSKASLGDFNHAIEDYDKAIGLAPRQPDLYYNRGLAKAGLKDYRGAIQDYSQAITLKTGYTQALYNRGIAWGQLKNFNSAARDFRLVTEQDPTDGGAWYLLGNAQFNTRDRAGSCASWLQASQLGHEKAKALITRHCK